MDIVIRVSENDSKVWKVYKLTEICGGGYNIKECIFNCNKRFKNLWLQFFLSQNQGFMRLFEKTVLK